MKRMSFLAVLCLLTLTASADAGPIRDRLFGRRSCSGGSCVTVQVPAKPEAKPAAPAPAAAKPAAVSGCADGKCAVPARRVFGIRR